MAKVNRTKNNTSSKNKLMKRKTKLTAREIVDFNTELSAILNAENDFVQIPLYKYKCGNYN